jgi:hypothetical protein
MELDSGHGLVFMDREDQMMEDVVEAEGTSRWDDTAAKRPKLVGTMNCAADNRTLSTCPRFEYLQLSDSIPNICRSYQLSVIAQVHFPIE